MILRLIVTAGSCPEAFAISPKVAISYRTGSPRHDSLTRVAFDMMG